MTEIESLCRQIDNKMKEEDICIFVLKDLKENILQTISMQDNTTPRSSSFVRCQLIKYT